MLRSSPSHVAAAACALTTRDAVAAPTTDSASGSIAITYQRKSNDGADSNAGGASGSGTAGTGEFAIPGRQPSASTKSGKSRHGGATFEPVAPFTDSTAYPIDWSKDDRHMTRKCTATWPTRSPDSSRRTGQANPQPWQLGRNRQSRATLTFAGRGRRAVSGRVR